MLLFTSSELYGTIQTIRGTISKIGSIYEVNIW